MKWLLFPILSFSAAAVAQDQPVEKAEYKCFVETSVSKKVVFYRWEVNRFQRNMNRLSARKVPNDGRSNRPYIKDVFECVLLDEPFKSAEANALDKVTPR
ncbi:TapY2 family type IVa secretion system protein [Shewanella sp. 0m-4]